MIAEAKLEQKARSYDIGKELGRGTWGVVYAARDQYGEKVAIKRLEPTELAKEQMIHRNWNPWKVMRNEAVQLEAAACSNIVPRRFEEDENGEPYIVMPQYKRFLSEVLRDVRNIPTNGDKRYLSSGLRFEDFANSAKRIANGLEEIHTVLKRPYGDWKPDNIAIDSDGNPLIADLGTTSIGRSISPRDNMGFEYTRAPEVNEEGSRPSERSDVYGCGALFYNMITGDYPKINKNEKVDVEIVPKKLRRFLKKCLAHEPSERYADGRELKKGLEKALEDFSINKFVRKWTLPITLPLALLGGLSYLSYIHEPRDLSMPQPRPRIQGMLYRPGIEVVQESIEFDSEEIPDLPMAHELGWVGSGATKMAKLSTDNRVVAYLVKTHYQALHKMGAARGYSDAQYETYMAYVLPEERKIDITKAGPVWPIIAKSIEVALTDSKTKNGKVDLEDICAISRFGHRKVAEAKRITGSQDYTVYRDAIDSKGRRLINKKEKELVDYWISYFHTDIN